MERDHSGSGYLGTGREPGVHGTYTITQSDMDAGQVDNTATATGNDPDDVEVSDTDTVRPSR
uniref:DUF7507 domain-containing protein n=1 Tax=Algoriphagus halophilus TaxID=226505 RepID=UPI0040378AEE